MTSPAARSCTPAPMQRSSRSALVERSPAGTWRRRSRRSPRRAAVHADHLAIGREVRPAGSLGDRTARRAAQDPRRRQDRGHRRNRPTTLAWPIASCSPSSRPATSSSRRARPHQAIAVLCWGTAKSRPLPLRTRTSSVTGRRDRDDWVASKSPEDLARAPVKVEAIERQRLPVRRGKAACEAAVDRF